MDYRQWTKNYLHRRLLAFKYAGRGVADLLRYQPNAQLHALATIIVVGLGLYLRITQWEWCILLWCMGLVIVTEALNTALEYLTDLVSPGFHPLAGKVKDVAAAAVLIAAMTALVVGVLIFWPRLAG